MNRKKPRIEICGGIASGKTSLTECFDGSKAHQIFENFRNNPFWKPFYEQPARYAFETEITFLLQHCHEIKKISSHNMITICDFSVILDRAYVEVTLTRNERQAFLAIYKEVLRQIGCPEILVHLVCDPDVELERIRKRGRNVEAAITRDYLLGINASVEGHVASLPKNVSVIKLRSDEIDFVHNSASKREVVDLILEETAELFSGLPKDS